MAAALAISLLVAQLGGKTLEIDPSQSSVKFRITHRFHDVTGVAKGVEAKAAIGADGKVLAMIRVPAASLDTGDANRDSDMREVLEVGKYPFVVYKGIAAIPSPTPSAPFDVTLKGELELHGVKQAVDVPVRVEPAGDGSLRIRGGTSLSLDAFRIERPALLFVKIDDECRIDVDVLMREAG